MYGIAHSVSWTPILFTATELRVFDRLESGATPAADVATRVGLSETAAERLLTALCALQQRARDVCATGERA